MRELLARQDENFLAFAATLTEQDWAQPSLCSEWTNKEVLAHLALGLHLPARQVVIAMSRRRWSFDAANALLTQEYAARSAVTDLLVAFERGRTGPRGVGRLLPARLLLGDHAVHHLDIALALGRANVLSPEIANAVLTTEVRIPNPFVPAAARARGLTLRTTDTHWSRPGDHALDVVGPAESMISALAGRSRALALLTGNGVASLRQRL
ncbi:maleylpyruvate isomerase family mycothiol-dependent enzyme [Kutzneria sp. CA-103260]|uniref:maleylpyruvate isomerase family mycothiol-dependent enzyme n=1 Tax=Kutzneria sp. CA-103260 TaxID=2802641 RepID=UPI001BA9352C|nr:maleylpyruvate isomerase family mycothiol-dependent enzyme [Kutzneria sp. CA-103260]QUQ67116.1 maleylpyruvate isomerase family mycothiol-dependent enzyme [Kutzneria sp. CA-103260]